MYNKSHSKFPEKDPKMMIYHLLSLTIAYFLDLLIGDPPHWPHPVKWIGRLISFCENRWNRGKSKKQKGVVMLLLVLFTCFSIVWILVVIGYKISPVVGVLLESIIIAS